MASMEGHSGQQPMTTNQEGTTANGLAKAVLTTRVSFPRSANAFLAVTLAVKDVFETFLRRFGGPQWLLLSVMLWVVRLSASTSQKLWKSPNPSRANPCWAGSSGHHAKLYLKPTPDGKSPNQVPTTSTHHSSTCAFL